MLLRDRHAKILATLGPASSSEEVIAGLVEAGADAFRLNFSHGSHAEHAGRLEIIQRVEKTYGRPIAVVADLQGPKLRIGTFGEGPIKLHAGARFQLDLDPDVGTTERVELPHPEIFAALAPGTNLILDDGKIRLRVTACDARSAETEVLIGGVLSDRKGVNVPDVVLKLSALPAKDRADLAFALEIGVSWIALSFVQRPEDVDEAKALIGDRAGLIAKIEKPSAVQSSALAEIVRRADGLMVARGDLGVEMPPEDVPMLQKRIVRRCRRAGKPVIVATQMLESMIRAPVPTRAEASDVATAVNEGADAVMLSGETAVGDYPVESVAIMNRIIRRTEGDPIHRTILDAVRPVPDSSTEDAISAATRQVAESVRGAVIVTYTSGGSTTIRVARERPAVPILALTASQSVAHRLALVWGVHSKMISFYEDIDEMLDAASDAAVEAGFATTGDKVVLTAGVPFATPGATNLLIVNEVMREGDDPDDGD